TSYPALPTTALGNGLFLASRPSQINGLYADGDPRRGRAYNVYYVGLNVGGLMAPLVCGTLGELYGWHYGFGAAGIGMFAGLGIYLAGRRYLPPEAARAAMPAPAPGQARRDRRRIWWLLLGVGIAATIFRGAYEQIGNTLPLWIDSGVDRSLGGWTIPMTWFQSLNPLLVIAMTPLLLMVWRLRAARGRESSPAMRMATGALLVAAAYLLLALVSLIGGDGRVAWPWLLAFFLVLTLGELYILPTGLGLFARLAPPRLGATTVASWFLAIFSGSLLAGMVGTALRRAAQAGRAHGGVVVPGHRQGQPAGGHGRHAVEQGEPCRVFPAPGRAGRRRRGAAVAAGPADPDAGVSDGTAPQCGKCAPRTRFSK